MSDATLETRVAALEARLRAAEDQLEIIQLLNTYGPLVDSGESEAAAALWVEGGAYDVGGITRLQVPADLVAMYESDGHQELVKTGVSHLTATPRITLNGDEAEALAYSFVILREGERWFVWRASANHFTLRRTDKGWRIVERHNRVLDGSEASHEALRRVMR
jgi:phage-related protein